MKLHNHSVPAVWTVIMKGANSFKFSISLMTYWGRQSYTCYIILLEIMNSVPQNSIHTYFRMH